jgi:muramoyltetrapeptide carboxypeptidase
MDMFLTHLRRAGYLDDVRGILCGTWDGCGPPADVEALLADRLGDLGVPVLLGADIGHGVPMQPLPLGLRARLDTATATLTFLEPPLTPPSR